MNALIVLNQIAAVGLAAPCPDGTYSSLCGLSLPLWGVDVGTSQTLFDAVAKVIGTLLIVAGIIAFFYLLYGGIQYMTAGGDAEKATAARTTILNAVIGIIIIVISYSIVIYLQTLFLTP